jgi:hypothetical protein
MSPGGDTVTTGRVPEVHPLALINPATTRRKMTTRPEIFSCHFVGIMEDMIIFWQSCLDLYTGRSIQDDLLCPAGPDVVPVIFFFLSRV